MINPELRRNLWLEITTGRIVFTLSVLGAILLLLVGIDGWIDAANSIYNVFTGLFLLVTGFWGTRRAAAALPEEITQGTWDAQRMSAISAWSMAWGKWLGATSHAWLVGGLCLLVALLSRFIDGGSDPSVNDALWQQSRLILLIVSSQAAAMTVSLVMLRLGSGRRAPRITLAHLIGLMIGFMLAGPTQEITELSGVAASVLKWWAWQFDREVMEIMIASAAAAFALLGIERGMRYELRQPSLPGAWTLFALAQFILMGGFLVHTGIPAQYMPLALSSLALSISVYMAYIGLFADMPDPIEYRILKARLKEGRYLQALPLLPLWVQSLGLLALVSIDFVLRIPESVAGIDLSTLPFEQAIDERSGLFVISLFFFVCRDLILAHVIRLLVPAHRVLMTLIITLLMVYSIIPGIFYAFKASQITVFMWPTEASAYDLGFLAPLIESVLLIVWWKVKTAQSNND